MNAFYGNPDANGDGVPDRAWEDANIVKLTPPYRMALAWAPETPVTTIRVHRLAAGPLLTVLRGILDHYGPQAEIEAARMHLFGGAYNFRLMRGAAQLSIHSWGAAIDLDPARNAFGQAYALNAGMMPSAVVELFRDQGWVWGGAWHKPDAMHFQAAQV